jgi:enoyl-CoA hydratase
MEMCGAIVVLTLNNPAKRNVLSGDLCSELSKAVEDAGANPAARAIIITGKPPAFCAGADLDDLAQAAVGHMNPVKAVYKSFMDVAMSALPTLAAVNGPAVGAGFNLALACDMRIACESASFDTRFLKLGLHPGGGHTWMLLRAVGWARATRLLLAAQTIDAHEAYRIGLVESVETESSLIERALGLLATAAKVSRELVTRTKATMRLALISDHQSAFLHETGEQNWSLGAPEFTAALARLRQR